MNGSELIRTTLTWNERGLQRALNGLSANDLVWRPRSDANPIGWLVWHGTRVEDRTIADLRGVTQAWIDEGWHAKFGRDPDPLDRGYGHTTEEVAAFRAPDTATLLAYHASVRARTEAYLDGLTDDGLDREVESDQGPSTVALRLANLVNEMVTHGGQAAYARGLLQGMGWSGV